MIISGVDIIKIARIRKISEKYGKRFLKRIYTEGEIGYCRGRAPQLASRFAAKEAVMKALGTGRSDVSWCDVEVVSNARKAPGVNLHKRAQIYAERIGATQFVLSVSHSKHYAVAFVVASN